MAFFWGPQLSVGEKTGSNYLFPGSEEEISQLGYVFKKTQISPQVTDTISQAIPDFSLLSTLIALLRHLKNFPSSYYHKLDQPFFVFPFMINTISATLLYGPQIMFPTK